MSTRRIDLVVAVRNEERNIELFVEQVQALALPPAVEVGMIFVEDSSTDQTVPRLRRYAKEHANLRYFCLKRGFGQPAAIAFGMKQSQADAVIMMDVDGGHPTEIIPEMIRRFLGGAEIVQAVRTTSEKRSIYRNLGTWLFNTAFIVLAVVDTRTQNVYFRLVSKRVRDQFLSHPRWLHFLRINFPRQEGLQVEHVSFKAESRQHGESKYSLPRLIKLALLAPLSVISPGRFSLLMGLLGLAAAALLAQRHFLTGGAAALLAAACIFQFREMSRESLLAKLEVRESGAPG
jgi:polyisoprenyl-phosphate glycosyltransferase